MFLKLLQFLRNHWFAVCIVLLVVLKHSCLAEQPFLARSNYPHDDTLFLTSALHIISGEWLGPFNQLTLLRGPLYPVWISFIYWLGLPLIHANDLLYLAACLVAIQALTVVVKQRWFLFPAFVFLYFAPHSYDYQTVAYSFRMSIYPSLALLVLGSALGLTLRLVGNEGGRGLWSVLFAVSFSFFWYVREEGIWIIPPLVLLLIYVVIFGIFRSDSRLKRSLRSMFLFVLMPALFFMATTFGLRQLNGIYYGSPVILEIKAPEFKRAYNALLSVEAREPIRYVHVTRDTLETLYQASPKMAELQDYLTKAADNLGFNGQLPAATFFFAFRDAVATAGYYKLGLPAVLRFYDELGEEIEMACSAGTLSCARLVYPLVPLWRQEHTNDLPASLLRQFDLIVRFPEFKPYINRVSIGDQQFLHHVGRLIHSSPAATDHVAQALDFPENARHLKLGLLDTVGEFLQIVRITLFYICLLLMIYFIIDDLKNQRLEPLPVAGCSLFGALVCLTAILSVIDVTSFHSLFRQRHGAVALVSLFVVCIIAEWCRRRAKRHAFRF